MHKKSGGHVHTGKDRKGKHIHPEYQLKKKGSRKAKPKTRKPKRK